MGDLPQEFLIENSSLNVGFLENKTGEITAGACLLFIVEIVNKVPKIGTGALFIVNNNILGLILKTDSIYLFDSHSKDDNGNLSSSGTVVLSKLVTLCSLGNCIRSVYYSAYQMTL